MIVSENPFDRVLQVIDSSRAKDINSLPFGFPRFEQYLPGIEQGTYYLITGNTGAAKTQITDAMFMFHPFEFLSTHKELGIKLKIFYFSLEISLEKKILMMISHYLKIKHNLSVSPRQLESKRLGEALGDDMFEKVKEGRSYVEKLMECVTIYQDIHNPFGIYKVIDNYAKSNGEIKHREQEFVRKNETTGEKETYTQDVFDHYIPNDPNEYVIIIIDSLNLLLPEKVNGVQMDLKGAMEKVSKEAIMFCNRYKYIPVFIQQQSGQQESLDNFKAKKLRPSLNGLGETKLTGRDSAVCIGVFNPIRHELSSDLQYDMEIMQDNYKSIEILKDRYGQAGVKVGLGFNGACNYFTELPKPGEINYEEILKKIK